MEEDSVSTVTLARMEPLLGIGVFSRRSRLSPKALRLVSLSRPGGRATATQSL